MFDGMYLIVFGRSIDKRDEQSKKTDPPKDVIVFGRLIVTRF